MTASLAARGARILLVGALALTASLLPPLPVDAADAPAADSAKDPEDVRGQLDVIYVRAAARGDKLVLLVRTAEEWGCRYLQSTVRDDERRSASIRWHVDTNRDPYTEHTVFASCQDGEYDVTFTEAGKRFPATRPDARTLRVVLPRERFGLDRPRLAITTITRVDHVSSGEVLFDEEDAAPALEPYQP